MPTEGDLRVCHIPQVPMKGFCVPVEGPAQALFVMNLLADYDLFQLEQNIKPDFSSVAGLEVFDGEGWIDWYDEDDDDVYAWAEKRAGTYYFVDPAMGDA